MKKFSMILLSVSLAFSLCGCNNSASENSSGYSGNNSNSSQTAASDKANTSHGSISQNGQSNSQGDTGTSESPENPSTPLSPENPNAPEDPEKPGTPEVPAPDSDELRLIYEGGIFLNALNTCNCTENGYYSVKGLSGGGYMNLTYVDFASRREIVLCSDSSCKHDNEKCASYLSRDLLLSVPGVFVNGEYLYLISTEYDQSGTTSAGEYTAPGYEPPEETRRAAIFRMNLDGTDRRKIWDADNIGDVIEERIFADGDDIWFAAKTPAIKIYENPESEKNGAVFHYAKNRSLMRYSPSENKIVERIPLDDYNNITLDIFGAADGRFILSGMAYPNGTSMWDHMEELAPSPNFGDRNDEGWELRKKSDTVYFTLDPSTKEIKETFRKNYGELLKLNNYEYDGSRMYCIREDYSVYAVDLLTGETREVNVPKGYRLDGFFLDKMCFTRVTEDWSDNNTYLTDLNGENMTVSELVSTTPIGSDYLLLGLSSDKAVMIYETEKIPSVNNPGAYHTGKRKAGLISIDDMVNGRANFEPIDALKDSWD